MIICVNIDKQKYEIKFIILWRGIITANKFKTSDHPIINKNNREKQLPTEVIS